MDNLFDYLIILFFILSAFGSLFKKKAEQKSNLPKRQSTKRVDNYKLSQDRKYNDPFAVDSTNQKGVDKENFNYSDNLPTLEDRFEKRIEFSELVKTSPAYQNAIKKDKDIINYKIVTPIKLKTDIKERLHNVNAVKEAFLLSEILNKPKALRYSGKNLYY